MPCVATAAGLSLGLMVAGAATAQPQREEVAAARLPRALVAQLRKDPVASGDVRYRMREADLDGDGRDEILVYLVGSASCGSGGCSALLFHRAGRHGWRRVMRTTVTQLPIGMLRERSHGWHDLSVYVAGGGERRHAVRLRFDGRRYPSNPSVAPALADGAPVTPLIEQGDPALPL